MRSLACSLLGIFVIWTSTVATAEEIQMAVWPGKPPGKIAARGAERDTSGPDSRKVAGRHVTRLGDVSRPMITVYPAPQDRNTGAAVLVCPGGGYHILAYDLEGTEVCEWLQSIGVTGILLKYRVPRAEQGMLPQEPLMDAQRALSIVRSKAKAWNIHPQRIGVLGFSAGGNLAARLSTLYNQRAYDRVDDVDDVSCRPDFAVLVYPAYLYDRNDKDGASVNLPVDKQTPPMFLTMAWDDRVGPENVLRMALALKRNNVPCEVHLYERGGHGFGLRRTEIPATSWPDRCAQWLRTRGLLERGQAHEKRD